MASLLSLALHGKLEYLTDILRTLLSDLAAHYVHKNPKLMLRRLALAPPWAWQQGWRLPAELHPHPPPHPAFPPLPTSAQGQGGPVTPSL